MFTPIYIIYYIPNNEPLFLVLVLENDYISELDSELVSAVGTQDTETTNSSK